MLFETLSQPKICFVFILLGIIYALIYSVCKFICVINKNNYFVQLIIDIIFFIFISISFYYCMLTFNYGESRLYLYISSLFGFVLFEITISNTLAKFIEFCYHKLKISTKKENNEKSKS